MVGFMIPGVLYLFKHTCGQGSLKKAKRIYISAFFILATLMFAVAWPFIYGSRMIYETILDIRVSFLVMAAVAACVYIVMMIANKISKESSREGMNVKSSCENSKIH